MPVESVEAYYAEIDRLAEDFSSYEQRLGALAFQEFIGTLDVNVIDALCDFRKDLLTAGEREQYEELIPLFSERTEENAVALIAVLVDLQNAVRVHRSKSVHRHYQPEDPLVVDNRDLRARNGIRDAELVALPKLKEMPGNWFVYKCDFNRLYLDPDLDPRIVKLVMTDVPREKIWLRLLPSPPDFVIGQTKPKHLWMCDVPTRVDESGESLPDHPIEKALGIMKLQWAGRYQSNKKYFSLSVEQLIRPTPAEPWCYGLMIHLDGQSNTPEIDLDNRLGHLDLAINYYEGVAAQERLQQPHDLPKKTDASYRIHLFRVEGMRFRLLSFVAQIFFPGTSCLFKWLKPRMHLGELPQVEGSAD